MWFGQRLVCFFWLHPMNRSEDLPFETRRAQTEGNMRGNHVPHDCTVPVRIGKFLSFRSGVDLADLELETCNSGCIHPNFDPSASDTLRKCMNEAKASVQRKRMLQSLRSMYTYSWDRESQGTNSF